MSLEQEVTVVSAGEAFIKSQYLYHEAVATDQATVESVEEPAAKKAKHEDRKKFKGRGQNKNRFQFNKGGYDTAPKLCQSQVNVAEGADDPPCTFPGCKYLHDVKQYLLEKPPDLGETCPVFERNGYCPRGVTCRFGSQHITKEGKNIVKLDSKREDKTLLSKDLQNELRKKRYDFSKANNVTKKVLELLDTQKNEDDEKVAEVKGDEKVEVANAEDADKHDVAVQQAIVEEVEKEYGECKLGVAGTEKHLVGREKKKIEWRDKLYLSPLTTLGNLPFRRVCKEWGADVTCGEMAMAGPLLQGVACEWALLRRHSSENLFGVQLCGNNPHLLARCVQLVEEAADVDFIDLNLGCPIELVYKSGAGSGLLRRKKHLESVVRSMSGATSLPITVKTRTGIYDDKPVAHTYMPLYTAAGVSLITIHGRSREQRYTRLPNWSYVNECAALANPTPVFGNGDILSYQEYNEARANNPNVAGVMIGRGALYKPWIFTEIKEQRDWDISSSERFEIIRKYVNYGFEHWGSDTKGVENTRRFLLEWLSFLYRYIPVGLLERPPQKMNERPPRYVGRDDLETLMASPNCADWIKITEMLCGPVPEGFQFLPKHKANAWATD